jgi:hypothetical protein
MEGGGGVSREGGGVECWWWWIDQTCRIAGAVGRLLQTPLAATGPLSHNRHMSGEGQLTGALCTVTQLTVDCMHEAVWDSITARKTRAC